MAINVEPVYSTGSSYHLSMIWQPPVKNWTRILVEKASTQHGRGAGLFGGGINL